MLVMLLHACADSPPASTDPPFVSVEPENGALEIRTFSAWGGHDGAGPTGFSLRGDEDGFGEREEARVSIEPFVPFEVRDWRGGREPHFDFLAPLTPETVYTVSLGGRSASFETPPMSFVGVRANPRHLDRVGRRAAVTLEFAYPVDLEEVRQRAGLSLERMPLDVSSWTLANGDTGVFVRLENLPELTSSTAELKAYVSPGLPAAHAPSYVGAAGQDSVTVRASWAAERVERITLAAQAGPDGAWIDVECFDPAAPPEHRLFDSWSQRCLPGPGSLALISVSRGEVRDIVPGPRGFRILGSFEPGPLRVTIQDGTRTVDGALFHVGHSEEVDVPEPGPEPWPGREIVVAGALASRVVVESYEVDSFWPQPLSDDEVHDPPPLERRLSLLSSRALTVDSERPVNVPLSLREGGTVIRVVTTDGTAEVFVAPGDAGDEPLVLTVR